MKMSRPMGAAKTGLTIVAGGLAGLAASAFVHRAQQAPRAAESCEAPVAAAPVARAVYPALEELHQRLVEAPAPSAAQSISGNSPPPEHRTDRPSVAEQVVRERKMFDSMLVAHEQEPRDGRWAAFTEQTIQKTFDVLGGRAKGRLERVDCRSESCVATLQWNNAAEAQADQETVVSYSGDGVQCGRTMVLGDQATSGKLYFDCSSHLDNLAEPK